ncbi:MAG: hypothetical protein ACE5FL_14060, partial [Myxococcota bacterium]
MTAGRLPSGNEFRRRIVNLSMPVSAIGLAIVLSCLYTILDMTSEQWAWFATAVVGYAAVFSYPNMRLQWWAMAPITRYLDRRDEGGDLEPLRRAAFARMIDLPRRAALIGAAGWVVPTLLIGVAMGIRFEQWGLYEILVVVMSGVAAGFVAGSVLLFATKSAARQTRDSLTSEIPDAGTRQALIRPLSLRTKILVCVTGVAVVPVVFAVMIAHSQSSRSFERFAVSWQNGILDTVEAAVGDWASGDYEAAIGDLLDNPGILPARVEVAVLDLSDVSDNLGPLRLADHLLEHVGQSVHEGASRGDSQGLPSRQVFTWRRLAGGRILVAATPREALAAGWAGGWLVYTALILGAIGVAFGLAYLIADDVGWTTLALKDAADRMASGDLRSSQEGVDALPRFGR